MEECAVEKNEYLKKNSRMMNSGEFDGMNVQDAKEKISEKIINMGVAKKQINYKMQDWSFNRQRYWGEPFPVVFCDKCGTVPLDEKYLEKDVISLPIQINGKMKKTISISKEASEEDVINSIKNTYSDLIFGEIKKVIYVQGKIINIICK